LHDTLNAMARLVDAELSIGDSDETQAGAAPDGEVRERPIQYAGRAVGRIIHSAHLDEHASDATRLVLEYAVDREMAVADLADQLFTDYEELNMIYQLLPTIATKASEQEIGMTLVEQAAQTLDCSRVSMLVLDEDRKNLRVLASRGLPSDVRDTPIPVAGSIAGQTLSEGEGLMAGDMHGRPDLARISRGTYDTSTFAVIRVPLQARGEPVGVLTATERSDGAEFTVRDFKLLEGLSAMGASALMHCRMHTAVNQQMVSTIKALACVVNAKDHYTHDHSGRVAQLSVATARHLGIKETESLRKVELAGLLHDIGKIGIPDAILSKTGGLTAKEFAVIRTHVNIGAGIVENVKGLQDVARAILHHHERHDGLGYPKGLAGDDIPLASKLISVSDAFDSLISDRPYRKQRPTELALQELDKCRGTQFDPAVLKAFKATIDDDPSLGANVPEAMSLQTVGAGDQEA
jgi:putative nucleotidyltransferase with HDIG domain